MSEPVILPVKPGSISKGDRERLRKAGVIVVEHDEPGSLRLLRPVAEMDSSQILVCAMKVLSSHDSASRQREEFAKLLSIAISDHYETRA